MPKIQKDIKELLKKHWWFRLVWIISFLFIVVLFIFALITEGDYRVQRILYKDSPRYNRITSQEIEVNCAIIRKEVEKGEYNPLGKEKFKSLSEKSASEVLWTTITPKEVKQKCLSSDSILFLYYKKDNSFQYNIFLKAFSVLLLAYSILWIILFKLVYYIVKGRRTKSV